MNTIFGGGPRGGLDGILGLPGAAEAVPLTVQSLELHFEAFRVGGVRGGAEGVAEPPLLTTELLQFPHPFPSPPPRPRSVPGPGQGAPFSRSPLGPRPPPRRPPRSRRGPPRGPGRSSPRRTPLREG